MLTKTIFRAPVAAVLSGWVILIGAVSVFATIPDGNGVIHGCYDRSGGTLRVIDNSVTNCKSSETALSWNVTGPQGPAGLAGATGPTGAIGPAGATGPAGSQGPKGDTGPTGATGPSGVQGPAGTDGKSLRAVALSSSDTRCGGLGGFEVFQRDPVTSVDTSEGVICNGATGAAGPAGGLGATGAQGATGPAGATGPQGPAGPAGPQGPTGINTARVLQQGFTIGLGSQGTEVDVMCGAGEMVTGGGFNYHLTTGGPLTQMLNRPIGPINGIWSWDVLLQYPNNTSGGGTGYAICVPGTETNS